MKIRPRWFDATLLLIALIALGACERERIYSDDGAYDGGDLVDPADPNALSSVLVVPGGVRGYGSPPAQGGLDAPVITGGGQVGVTAGGQAIIELGFSSTSGYRDCYVQVQGASEYFRISATDPTTYGTVQIPVNVPDNVASGGFTFYSCIAGTNGSVSNPIATPVTVTRPGDDPGPGSNPDGEFICSDSGSTPGCTLDYCVDTYATNCYYELNGSQYPCDCYDTTQCVEQVITAMESIPACGSF
ncbi:hypothetical protein [Nannocystis sp.]|uniref:hypothetical protein n=1 Tax=Nannocystis sp. TaxID=1962667 RepID=UPI00242058C1|nr:hypothetical protein [Nannocystis sp.]MBK7830033.1 hypothetical protein [Nannocystis sp.]MBK9752011.1 hypothetical protein [Nannocystis sp.]